MIIRISQSIDGRHEHCLHGLDMEASSCVSSTFEQGVAMDEEVAFGRKGVSQKLLVGKLCYGYSASGDTMKTKLKRNVLCHCEVEESPCTHPQHHQHSAPLPHCEIMPSSERCETPHSEVPTGLSQACHITSLGELGELARAHWASVPEWCVVSTCVQ